MRRVVALSGEAAAAEEAAALGVAPLSSLGSVEAARRRATRSMGEKPRRSAPEQQPLPRCSPPTRESTRAGTAARRSRVSTDDPVTDLEKGADPVTDLA